MQPIILEGTWVVKASQERIYKVVTDFEKAPRYFPLVAAGMKIISKKGNNLTINARTKTFGVPFEVLMETQLLPGKGFTSINTSVLAIEKESFMIEKIPNGSRINYRNEVQIKNNILQFFARIIIGKPALLFWKFAYIDRLLMLVDKIN